MARTVVSVRGGLDTTVQATVCLDVLPKPRPSARRRRYAVRLLGQSLRGNSHPTQHLA
ncbi:MAG: hypothetical protein NZ874_05850 [Fimbriimonadales bacterium]|nr:hypothetical protein [Fimbriimonadales bacterium]